MLTFNGQVTFSPQAVLCIKVIGTHTLSIKLDESGSLGKLIVNTSSFGRVVVDPSNQVLPVLSNVWRSGGDTVWLKFELFPEVHHEVKPIPKKRRRESCSRRCAVLSSNQIYTERRCFFERQSRSGLGTRDAQSSFLLIAVLCLWLVTLFKKLSGVAPLSPKSRVTCPRC